MFTPLIPSMELNNKTITIPEGSAGELPKGITPARLLEQVRGTAPFIFDLTNPVERLGKGRNHRFLEILRNPPATFDGLSYFELCLAAHHGTVATFVPTDVDNQIRFKLWNPRFSKETI